MTQAHRSKWHRQGSWRRCVCSRLVLAFCALVWSLALAGCEQAVSETRATQWREAQFLSVPGRGYSRPPAQLTPEFLAQEGWKSVGLPSAFKRDVLAAAGLEGQTLTDWYRLDLSHFNASQEPQYLYIPRWKTVGQVAIYADGRLMYASQGSMTLNGYNHPLLIPLNAAADELLPMAVTLRIDHLRNSGSALSTVWVGPAKALVWRYQLRQLVQTQLPLIGSGAFLAVGFFALAIWIKLRRDALYLIFFATSVMAFLRMLHYHVGGGFLPLSDEWMEWIKTCSLIWLVVFCHCLMERLHRLSMRGVTRFLMLSALLWSAVTVPGLGILPTLTLLTPMINILMVPVAALIFYDALRKGFRQNSRETWVVAGWLFIAALCCIYDLLLQTNWVSPEGIYTNPYAIVGVFGVTLYIMYGRYVGAMENIEQANLHLAQRLSIREAELMASHARLRDIERIQMLSEERQRLTQDMHDGLGSSLVTALRAVEGGDMTQALLGDILKACIDDLKLTIDSMEPIEADLLLLLATLRFRLGPRLKAAGVRLNWEVQDIPKLSWLNPRSGLHILRIFQEAFANILKHTRATEVHVRTGMQGPNVVVSIQDNGTGFDYEAVRLNPKGRGLHNQMRRAQAINGSVQWVSGPLGTQFTLLLPLSEAEER